MAHRKYNLISRPDTSLYYNINGVTYLFNYNKWFINSIFVRDSKNSRQNWIKKITEVINNPVKLELLISDRFFNNLKIQPLDISINSSVIINDNRLTTIELTNLKFMKIYCLNLIIKEIERFKEVENHEEN